MSPFHPEQNSVWLRPPPPLTKMATADYIDPSEVEAERDATSGLRPLSPTLVASLRLAPFTRVRNFDRLGARSLDFGISAPPEEEAVDSADGRHVFADARVSSNPGSERWWGRRAAAPLSEAEQKPRRRYSSGDGSAVAEFRSAAAPVRTATRLRSE